MEYKDTLNLPKTKFSMKANLTRLEPSILERWEKEDIYKELLKKNNESPLFVLHDGPPYANGNIHIGHALNKILKDIIVKSKSLSGYKTPYVPGWDCHGLPIEHNILKKLRSKKEGMTRIDIRKMCREYAERYVDIQREEFKRLGILGDWDSPYLTMTYDYEAAILREFARFVKAGAVYKSKKPVFWCAECETALAEAEVEYMDHVSPSVFVKFQIKDIPENGRLKGLSGEFPDTDHYIIIWTTTPWTLVANLGISLHPDKVYVLLKVNIDSHNEVFVMAEELYEACMASFGFEKSNKAERQDPEEGSYVISARFQGRDLKEIRCQHPFIDRESIIITGEHVTMDQGTGCVHTAPGHGQEDYEIGLRYNLDIYTPVDHKGRFTTDGGEFSGIHVFRANKGIIEKMKTGMSLLKEEEITHSYPHCWRCRKPIIFRATEQWFISMETNDLRERSLRAINNVSWIPPWGRDRIYLMIEGRPDWCISRQRSWGVPIPGFICTECNRLVIDHSIVEHIAEMVEREGADIWFTKDADELLPQDTICPACGKKSFHKEMDILDVWFDSGVSHAAVLRKRDALHWPADLYLEGSDQHRGWFHSSLLVSVGTESLPPYKSVLTHGFVVDAEGKKMSKTVGNVVSPHEVINRYGAEILRLWVAAEDYREDIRISSNILDQVVDSYRKIRNTCRFLIGNIWDFSSEKDWIPDEDLLEIDRWALHKLQLLIKKVKDAYSNFEFHIIFHSLNNFCSVDMSAIYFDILKDRLYTFRQDSTERRSAQRVLYQVLTSITSLMAPVLSFTAEEVWEYIPDNGRDVKSVFLSSFPDEEEMFIDADMASRWDRLFKIRGEAARVLEEKRRDKIIGHSLEAKVTLFAKGELFGFIKAYKDELPAIFIVSQVELIEDDIPQEALINGEIEGLGIIVSPASGKKCERCWNYSESVGDDTVHPTICKRCVEALT
ncbi:MAG: isoleucine--tRNA ligase [Nitrospirota bacterium]